MAGRRARIDLSRVAASALDAAVNGEQPRRSRFSGVRAVAAGAVLAAAGRLVVRKAPTPRIAGLAQMPDLSELTDRVRDRLADRGWIEDEGRVDEDFDEEDEDFDDEPEAEADEEEPEDEDEWDEEDEQGHEEEEPEGAASDDSAPDLMQVLGQHASPPPLRRRKGSRDGRRLDPAARPPEPPPRAEDGEREQKRKTSKAKAGAS